MSNRKSKKRIGSTRRHLGHKAEEKEDNEELQECSTTHHLQLSTEMPKSHLDDISENVESDNHDPSETISEKLVVPAELCEAETSTSGKKRRIGSTRRAKQGFQMEERKEEDEKVQSIPMKQEELSVTKTEDQYLQEKSDVPELAQAHVQLPELGGNEVRELTKRTSDESPNEEHSLLLEPDLKTEAGTCSTEVHSHSQSFSQNPETAVNFPFCVTDPHSEEGEGIHKQDEQSFFNLFEAKEVCSNVTPFQNTPQGLDLQKDQNAEDIRKYDEQSGAKEVTLEASLNMETINAKENTTQHILHIKESQEEMQIKKVGNEPLEEMEVRSAGNQCFLLQMPQGNSSPTTAESISMIKEDLQIFQPSNTKTDGTVIESYDKSGIQNTLQTEQNTSISLSQGEDKNPEHNVQKPKKRMGSTRKHIKGLKMTEDIGNSQTETQDMKEKTFQGLKLTEESVEENTHFRIMTAFNDKLETDFTVSERGAESEGAGDESEEQRNAHKDQILDENTEGAMATVGNKAFHSTENITDDSWIIENSSISCFVREGDLDHHSEIDSEGGTNTNQERRPVVEIFPPRVLGEQISEQMSIQTLDEETLQTRTPQDNAIQDTQDKSELTENAHFTLEFTHSYFHSFGGTENTGIDQNKITKESSPMITHREEMADNPLDMQCESFIQHCTKTGKSDTEATEKAENITNQSEKEILSDTFSFFEVADHFKGDVMRQDVDQLQRCDEEEAEKCPESPEDQEMKNSTNMEVSQQEVENQLLSPTEDSSPDYAGTTAEDTDAIKDSKPFFPQSELDILSESVDPLEQHSPLSSPATGHIPEITDVTTNVHLESSSPELYSPDVQHREDTEQGTQPHSLSSTMESPNNSTDISDGLHNGQTRQTVSHSLTVESTDMSETHTMSDHSESTFTFQHSEEEDEQEQEKQHQYVDIRQQLDANYVTIEEADNKIALLPKETAEVVTTVEADSFNEVVMSGNVEQPKKHADEKPVKNLDSLGDRDKQSHSITPESTHMEVSQQAEFQNNLSYASKNPSQDCADIRIEDAGVTEKPESLFCQIGVGSLSEASGPLEQDQPTSSSASDYTQETANVPLIMHTERSSPEIYSPDVQLREEDEQETQPHTLSSTIEPEIPNNSTDISDVLHSGQTKPTVSNSLNLESTEMSETSTLSDHSESTFKLQHSEEEISVKQGASNQRKKMGSTRRIKRDQQKEETCDATTTDGDHASEDINIQMNTDTGVRAEEEILDVGITDAMKENEFFPSQTDDAILSMTLSTVDHDQYVDSSPSAEGMSSSFSQCSLLQDEQEQEKQHLYVDIGQQLDGNYVTIEEADNKIALLPKETAEVITTVEANSFNEVVMSGNVEQLKKHEDEESVKNLDSLGDQDKQSHSITPESTHMEVSQQAEFQNNLSYATKNLSQDCADIRTEDVGVIEKPGSLFCQIGVGNLAEVSGPLEQEHPTSFSASDYTQETADVPLIMESTEMSETSTLSDHSESTFKIQHSEEEISVKQGASRQRKKMGSTRRIKRDQQREETCDAMTTDGDHANEDVNVQINTNTLKTPSEDCVGMRVEDVGVTEKPESLFCEISVGNLSEALGPSEQELPTASSASDYSQEIADVPLIVHTERSSPEIYSPDVQLREEDEQETQPHTLSSTIEPEIPNNSTDIFDVLHSGQTKQTVSHSLNLESTEMSENSTLSDHSESTFKLQHSEEEISVKQGASNQRKKMGSTRRIKRDQQKEETCDATTTDGDHASEDINIQMNTDTGVRAEEEILDVGITDAMKENEFFPSQTDDAILSMTLSTVDHDQYVDSSPSAEGMSSSFSQCSLLQDEQEQEKQHLYVDIGQQLDGNYVTIEEADNKMALLPKETAEVITTVEANSFNEVVMSGNVEQLKKHEDKESVKNLDDQDKQSHSITPESTHMEVSQQAELQNNLSYATKNLSQDCADIRIEDVGVIEKPGSLFCQIGVGNLAEVSGPLEQEHPTSFSASDYTQETADVPLIMESTEMSENSTLSDHSESTFKIQHSEEEISVKQGASRQRKKMGSTRRIKRDQQREETCDAMTTDGDHASEDVNVQINTNTLKTPSEDCVGMRVEDVGVTEKPESLFCEISVGNLSEALGPSEQELPTASSASDYSQEIADVPLIVHTERSSPEIYSPDVQLREEDEQETQPHTLSSTMEPEIPNNSTDISDVLHSGQTKQTVSNSLNLESTEMSETSTLSDHSESTFKLQHSEEEISVKQGASNQRKKMGSTRRIKRDQQREETCDAMTTDGDHASEDVNVQMNTNTLKTPSEDHVGMRVEDVGVTEKPESVFCEISVGNLSEALGPSEQELLAASPAPDYTPEIADVPLSVHAESYSPEIYSPDVQHREDTEQGTQPHVLSSTMEPEVPNNGTPQASESQQVAETHFLSHSFNIESSGIAETRALSDNCASPLGFQYQENEGSLKSSMSMQKRKIGSTRRQKRESNEVNLDEGTRSPHETEEITTEGMVTETVEIKVQQEETLQSEQISSGEKIQSACLNTIPGEGGLNEYQAPMKDESNNEHNSTQEQDKIQDQVKNTIPEMSVSASQYPETEDSPSLTRRKKLSSTRRHGRDQQEKTERKYVVMDGMLIYTDTETSSCHANKSVDKEIHDEENAEVPCISVNTMVSPPTPELLKTDQESGDNEFQSKDELPEEHQHILASTITTSDQAILEDITSNQTFYSSHEDTQADKPVSSVTQPVDSLSSENILMLPPLENSDSIEESKPRKKRMGSSRKLSNRQQMTGKNENNGEEDVKDEVSDNLTITAEQPLQLETHSIDICATDKQELECTRNDKWTNIDQSECSETASGPHNQPEVHSITGIYDQSPSGKIEISESSGTITTETSFSKLNDDDSQNEPKSMLQKRKMGSSRRGQGLGNRMKGEAAKVEEHMDDTTIPRQEGNDTTPGALPLNEEGSKQKESCLVLLQNTQDLSVEREQLLPAFIQSSDSYPQSVAQTEGPDESTDERVQPASNPSTNPQTSVKKRKMGSTRKDMRRQGEEEKSDPKRDQGSPESSVDDTAWDSTIVPTETVTIQKITPSQEPEGTLPKDESSENGCAAPNESPQDAKRKLSSRRGGLRGTAPPEEPEDQHVSKGPENDSSISKGTQENVHREGVAEQGLVGFEGGSPKVEQPVPLEARIKSDLERKYGQGDTLTSLDETVSFNVVMVGESSVGKTSFIRRFESGQFFLDHSATIGVDTFVQTLAVDDKLVKLQIWDTAGQERFHSITRQVLHKAQGLILMYDISSCETFSAVRKWIACIEEVAPSEVIILLLGNKNDSEERQVLPPEGERLAQEYNIHFMECSAATGHNVTQAMETMARLLQQTVKVIDKGNVILHNKPQQKSSCC